jgi:glycosyltransferase involved in cell wall biosynthesis
VVEVLPTVVDLEKFQYKTQTEKETFTIGWIGSPHTAKYLNTIQSALKELSLKTDVKIIFVGSGDFVLDNVLYEKREWSESTEVEEIQEFDVGIMPLIDSPWERGKCGFKLIQYMASSKPVIASPVGVNVEIVKNGVNGFLAKNSEEWIKYFMVLKNNFNLRKEMSTAGRKIVEENYSLQIVAPKLTKIFKKLVKK